MTVKDLIKTLSIETKYSINYANNPHNIIWWGQGNRLNDNDSWWYNKTILSICWTKKGILIYV